MDQWIANGAQVAWLIDPIEKSITIYRCNESPEHLTNPTSVQGTGPITGFELVLSRVWD
jgi:Uma2 family endonuclease